MFVSISIRRKFLLLASAAAISMLSACEWWPGEEIGFAPGDPNVPEATKDFSRATGTETSGTGDAGFAWRR